MLLMGLFQGKWRRLVASVSFLLTLVDESRSFSSSVPSLRREFTVTRKSSHDKFTTINTARPSTRAWWTTSISYEQDATRAVQELVRNVGRPSNHPQEQQQRLVFLFVNQSHQSKFEEIVQQTHQALSREHPKLPTELFALVGGGVVGGGKEVDAVDGGYCMSMLAGLLSPTARATGFSVTDDQPLPHLDDPKENKASSHVLLFADPWAQTSRILQKLEEEEIKLILGGISCPTLSGNKFTDASTVAWNDKCLPPGSVVALQLSGTVGLQAIVAQGCRPIGPVFTVTSASGNVIAELDGVSALEQLERVANVAEPQDKALIQSGGLLCGVAATSDHQHDKIPQDFLARQIVGFQPKVAAGTQAAGAVVIATPVQEGDAFCFHVRDKGAAREDMRVMIQRAKTERLFVGPARAGVPLAAIQISCVARGQSLFGEANVDLGQVRDLLGGDSDEDKATELPIAGFFANGEIGPIGLAGFGLSSFGGTHVHGFTTVVALLCDYSSRSVEDPDVVIAEESPSSSEAWG